MGPSKGERDYRARGLVYLRARHPLHAMGCFRAALRERFDDPELHELLGRSLDLAFDYESAADCYARALSMRGDPPPLRRALARARLHAGDPRAAVRLLLPAARAGNDAQAISQLAIALSDAGKSAPALRLAQRAVSLAPGRADLHGNLGIVLYRAHHPGSSSAVDDSGEPISVSCGERFLARIFNALAESPLFARTLLIVTYDEHGGCFDHVYPPPAVSPFPSHLGIQGFRYDQYGARVPALFLNPYVRPGLFRPSAGGSFDHASILATLRDQFSLTGSPSPRVDKAPVLRGLIDPNRSPIVSPVVPVPDCVWQSRVKGRHSFPVLASALARRRALRQLGRRT